MTKPLKTSNKYSDHKIVHFADKLTSYRTGEVSPPIYVRVKPINRCCHDCSFCVYNKENSNMHDTMDRADVLSKEKLFEILNDFKDMGVKALTYSGGGEPLMHPNIVDVLNKTKENNIDLSILTNGQLLKGERADALKDARWVRVSMDYCTPEQFVASRGGTEKMFNDVIDNIYKFSDIKNPDCDLSVNFIITKENYKNILLATKLLKDAGVDNVRFSPVWLIDYVSYHQPLIQEVKQSLTLARSFESETFKVYDSYNITPEAINRKYTKCFIMQTIPVIGADYNVYTCHNKSYTEEACIGSIKDQSFKQLWFSEKTKKFFDTYNPQVHCKCQCANDKKNLFIHDLVNCYGDNFV